jgi:hypothetical protein
LTILCWFIRKFYECLKIKRKMEYDNIDQLSMDHTLPNIK